jgi:hypothetical protein
VQLELADRVRLEIAPEGSRAITHIYVGDREIPATPALMTAVARLCIGERQLPFDLLKQHGVFVEKAPDTLPTNAAALHPRAELGLRLQPGLTETQIDGALQRRTVLPEASLPIAGFVEPGVLVALQELARRVRSAWLHLLRAAHSRGRTVEPEAARQLLWNVATERIAEDPVLERLLDVGDGRLTARAPLQADTFQYPIARVELIDDRNPGLATDRVRYDIRPHESAALGRALGALGQGATPAELRASFADVPRLIGLVGSLLGTDLTTERPAPISLEPGQVVHLGHATLLANLGGAYVLIDPWFPSGSRNDRLAPLPVSRLPALAGIFFTHHHWDHVNLPTLMKLDKRVPVYLPKQVSGDPSRPLVPKTAAWLRSLGFQSIHELGRGMSVDIGDGGKVEAASFTGEDPTDIRWIGNTWVLVHDGKAAWVHVDSGPDRRGEDTVTNGTAAALRAKYGTLDPVFTTRRQERGTMVEHDWSFLLAPSDAWVRPTENCDNDAAFLGRLAGATGGQLVLYSEGGADWYPDATDFLRPGAEAAANDAVQMYLWDDMAAIEAAVAGASGDRGVVISLPFDVWTIGGGASTRLSV